MDTHELAWAAGFFDGEGSIYVDTSKGKGYCPTCVREKKRAS